MTDTEIRTAIAEACGWINQGKAKGIPTLEHRWTRQGVHPQFVNTDSLPDYPNDLNAMHEAESILTPSQLGDYQNDLMDVLIRDAKKDNADYWLIKATARQRAEAFLRTIGKWKEEVK